MEPSIARPHTHIERHACLSEENIHIEFMFDHPS